MSINVRQLGHQDYHSCWQEMQDYTLARDASSADEIWIVEHPPVFTQGLNCQPEHLLQVSDIPVVNNARGGQIN